jgi:hypothetical protein
MKNIELLHNNLLHQELFLSFLIVWLKRNRMRDHLFQDKFILHPKNHYYSIKYALKMNNLMPINMF